MTPAHPTRRAMRTGIVVALVLVAAACEGDGREMREPGPDQTLSIITTTSTPEAPAAIDTVPASAPDQTSDTGPVLPDDEALALDGFDVTLPWGADGPIPRRHTCDGADVSPAIRWTGLPESTVEVAVVVLDSSSGTERPDQAVHWIVTGLDPDRAGLVEGRVPASAVVATNTFGVATWSGPCPPSGNEHLYRVEVRALAQQTEMPAGTDTADMLRSIDLATIAMATGTGRYTRAG